ncbi:MAG: hypothetical protein ABIO44_01995, partial [Saprospiraceae bacterium]
MNSNFTKLASCLSYLFMLTINLPLWAYSPIGKEPVKQIIGKQSHYGGRTNDGFLAKMIPCTEPIITPTSDRKACHNDIGAAINFQANVTNPTFTWIKKSSIAGQATSIAIQGYGNIPSYTATNTTCLILTDSIIVTPYNKLSNIDSCAGIPDTFLLKTLPRPVVNTIRDSSFCNGQTWTPPAFNGTCKDSTVYYWQKRPGPGGTTTPGLALSGKGNLPTFTIVNNPASCLILTDTIIVTPYYISKGLNDSCSGAIMKFIIKSVPSPSISITNDTSYC